MRRHYQRVDVAAPEGGRAGSVRVRYRPGRARRLPGLVPESQGQAYLRLVPRLPRIVRPLAPARPDHGQAERNRFPRPAMAGREYRMEDRKARSGHRRPAGVQLGGEDGTDRGQPHPPRREAPGRPPAIMSSRLRPVHLDHPRPRQGRAVPGPAGRLLGDRLPAPGGPRRRNSLCRPRGRLLAVPRGRIEGERAPADCLPDRPGGSQRSRTTTDGRTALRAAVSEHRRAALVAIRPELPLRPAETCSRPQGS